MQAATVSVRGSCRAQTEPAGQKKAAQTSKKAVGLKASVQALTLVMFEVYKTEGMNVKEF
jgi:hypothetical protein